MDGIPFIHLFQTPLNYYLYDVNSDVILKINQFVYQYLKTGSTTDNEHIQEIVTSTLKRLKADGFLSSKHVREMVHPANDTLEYYLNNRVNMLTLQVTQNCNLRCKYCIYSGNYENRSHSNLKMNFDMAKKGIEFLIAHSIDTNEVFCSFYGGEPLLMFDLIKSCVNYAQESAEGQNINFTLTTNGTLLSNEMIDFFIKYKFSIVISIDGPREIHDINRRFSNDKGSFNSMYHNLQLIMKRDPDYFKNYVGFSTVIDPEADFNCVNDFISGNDIFNESAIVSNVISDRNIKTQYKISEDFVLDRNYEIFKYYLSKLGKLDKSFASKILSNYMEVKRKRGGKQNISINGLPDKTSRGGPCIPGTQRLFLNANGDFYPCERVSEASDVMKIGNIDDGIQIDKVRNLLNVGKISEEKCKNCWVFIYCALCASDADNGNELSYQKMKTKCISMCNSIENDFKDYCTLRELGHEFQVGTGFADYKN
jgi:uncharacterized protein